MEESTVAGSRAPVSVRPAGWLDADGGSTTDLLAWAERAEDLGFEGIFLGDRLMAEATHGGNAVYGASMLDITVALSAIAARTTRLRLGSLIMVFPYRHPIQLTKTIASLDALSGGRVILGSGIGWNAREFGALGLSMSGRAARFEESLEILRALWPGKLVTHHGEGWQFEDVAVLPPGVQPGGPPVWMASFAPSHDLRWTDGFPRQNLRQLDRVGRLANGWVPLVYSALAKRRIGADVLAQAWDIVLDSARRAGRQRDDLDFVFSDWCFVLDGPDGVQRCKAALARFFNGTWEEALRTYTIGTVDEVVHQIKEHTVKIDRVDHYILTALGDEDRQLESLVGVAEGLQ